LMTWVRFSYSTQEQESCHPATLGPALDGSRDEYGITKLYISRKIVSLFTLDGVYTCRVVIHRGVQYFKYSFAEIQINYI
jgi:hypothetical protein